MKKGLLKIKRILIMTILIISGVFLTNLGVIGQSPTGPFEDLQSSYLKGKISPSQAPVTLLSIQYAALLGNSSKIPCPVGSSNQFSRYQFEVDNPNSYIIVKKGDPVTKAIEINRTEIDSETAQFVVYLSLESTKFKKLRDPTTKKLLINVGLRVKRLTSACIYKDEIVWDGDGTTPNDVDVPEMKDSTFIFNPNIVPDQELLDKSKKTVGQFQVKWDVPSLVANRRGANLYFKTDNLFSTNGKDKNSKVELRFGAERSLRDSWYIPGNIEAKINGDQRAKNATFVFSGGIKTKLPWGATRNFLFNSAIKVPQSPVFEFRLEYHRRIKQDLVAAKDRLDKNALALFNQFTWNPIQLFPGKCETDKTITVEVNPNKRCLDPNEISLEIVAKNWYFPFEKAIAGQKVRKFETRIESSLLIPLSKFPIIGSSFISTTDGSKKRLKITYQTGVNDANGFKHSTQVLFGIEVIK